MLTRRRFLQFLTLSGMPSMLCIIKILNGRKKTEVVIVNGWILRRTDLRLGSS
jgi:hypothetical protein